MRQSTNQPNQPNQLSTLPFCSMRYAPGSISDFPPGPLPARRIIGHDLTGRKVGPYGPYGPEAPFRIPPSQFHYGQSFEGQKNDPLESLASFQNALGAKGSPSIGYRITLTGVRGGSRRIDS